MGPSLCVVFTAPNLLVSQPTPRPITLPLDFRHRRDNDDINRLRRGLSHAFYFDAYQLDEAVTPAGVLGQAGSKQRGEAGFEGAPEVSCLREQGNPAGEPTQTEHAGCARLLAGALASTLVGFPAAGRPSLAQHDCKLVVLPLPACSPCWR